MSILDSLQKDLGLTNDSVTTGYLKFKSPYFEIYVGDNKGSNFIRLPLHVERLMERLEVLEFLGHKDSNSIDNITITFAEGSREPAGVNAGDTSSSLYPMSISSSVGSTLGNNITSSLTNLPGAVADLKYDSGLSLNLVDVASTFQSIFGQLSNFITIIKKLDETITTTTGDPLKGPLAFSQLHKLKVVLGYLEDPTTRCAYIGDIVSTEMNFPDNGQSTFIIKAASPMATAAKIKPVKGKMFTSQGLSSTLPSDIGKLINSTDASTLNGDFNDISIKDLINNIADSIGGNYIISDLPLESSDSGIVKVWAGGESLNQFLSRLARVTNAYYKIYYDATLSVPVILFVDKTIFDSTPIIENDTLFTFKAAGSIIKSIKISETFNNGFTSGHSGIDKDGTRDVTSKSKYDMAQTAGTGTSAIPSNQTNMGKSLGEDLLDGVDNVSDRSTIAPGSKTTTNKAQAITNTIVKTTKFIELDLLGYPKIIGGTYKIKNIGFRYSGNYQFTSVTHTLDSNGFHTKVLGTSGELPTGGGAKGSAKDIQDNKLKVQLTSPAQQLSSAASDIVSAFGGSDTSTVPGSSSNVTQDYIKSKGAQ